MSYIHFVKLARDGRTIYFGCCFIMHPPGLDFSLLNPIWFCLWLVRSVRSLTHFSLFNIGQSKEPFIDEIVR